MQSRMPPGACRILLRLVGFIAFSFAARSINHCIHGEAVCNSMNYRMCRHNSLYQASRVKWREAGIWADVFHANSHNRCLAKLQLIVASMGIDIPNANTIHTGHRTASIGEY